jgi:EAL domain-containing protein (putative c-di-GMP-specific phosphodiesterase class I)
VETEAQRDFLLGTGCQYAQGYLFSPAVEPDQISDDWLSGAASVGQTAELLA